MHTNYRGSFLGAALAAGLLVTFNVWAEEPDPSGATPTAQVQGKIIELGSPDPLEGALVTVVATTKSTETDTKGFYCLETGAGEIQLRCSAVGHAPVTKTLWLQPGQILKVNISLARVDFASKAFVVKGKKDKPQILTTTLNQKEIKKIPGSAGDALRAVQSLPGIAVNNDYSGILMVQGGGPNDNLYLLDNIPWPFPFHFGGIISTINSDLLSAVDLNAAGFGARWGNVLGAVLNGKTRPGRKDRFQFSADINMVMSQGLIEGPLGIGDAVFTLSGRRSYFDLLLGKSMSSTFTALPYFWDLGGSLDFSLDRNNHFRVLALGNDDIMGLNIKEEDMNDPDLSGEFRSENRAVTTGFNWINTALPDFTSALTPYYYQTLAENTIGGNGFGSHYKQNVFGIKEEAEWKAGETLGLKHEIGFGGGLETVDYTTLVYFFKSYIDGIPSDPIGTTVVARSVNCAAYLQDRVQVISGVAFTAGVRYDKSDVIAVDVANPRVSVDWQYDDRTLWKAAWGYYSQFPGGLEVDPQFGNTNLNANRAEHTVLSLEKKFSRELTGRIDAYYKRFFDLVVQDPATTNYANAGLGQAKGVELFLRQDLGERFFGWISYAFSKSERLGPPRNEWTLYPYDQTNIFTAVANYNFSPAWSAGAKLHYNSGPWVKNLQGRFQDAGGTWRPIFSDVYDRRLADYARLDVRTDYSWRYEGWRLNVYFEILNVLNRANPVGITYTKNYSEPNVINNLPLIPYFGVGAQF